MKFIFSKPKKNKFLIFDREGSKILKKMILKKTKGIEVIDIRYESINIYVLIYTFFRKFFFYFKNGEFVKNLKKNYIVNYIKFVSPKIILTFIDNNFLFYRLKNYYPDAKYICFQNGLRDSNFFRNLKNISKKNKLRCDLLFVHGENIKKKISKFIKAKVFATGNIINNHYLSQKKTFKKSIIFISQAKVLRGDKSIDFKNNYITEIFLFNILKNFCIKNNIELFFLSRCRKEYKNEISKKINFNKIIFCNQKERYTIINSAKLIVFINSTLGYEALSKYKKITCFPFTKKILGWRYRKFGVPKNYKTNGEFWSSSRNKEKINKIISKIYYMKKQQWHKLIQKYKNIMSFDKKNKKTKILISQNLKYF